MSLCLLDSDSTQNFRARYSDSNFCHYKIHALIRDDRVIKQMRPILVSRELGVGTLCLDPDSCSIFEKNYSKKANETKKLAGKDGRVCKGIEASSLLGPIRSHLKATDGALLYRVLDKTRLQSLVPAEVPLRSAHTWDT